MNPYYEDDDAGTPLEAALYYASLGWRVLPIKPGMKRPPMDSWQHAATTVEKVIRNWYSGLYAGHGVGIATGHGSGIFVLDVDVSGDKRGDETLAALEATHGPLPDTVRAITGTGGKHIVFKLPADLDIRNNASTRLGPGLDIRGEGGQIVAAPTIHPNGKPYAWEFGYGPDEIPVADAPAWLLDLLAVDPVATTPARQPVTEPTRGTALDDDSIAERIARDHDWHTLLYADGWQQSRSSRAGETTWTRPGKDPRDGASAVLHEPDGPLVFWSTDPVLAALHRSGTPTRDGTGWALSLFGYIAATRHGGDRSACARAYRQALTAQQVQSVTADHGATAYAALTGATATTGTEGADTDDSTSDDDWAPVDLASIAAEIRTGTREPIRPTLLNVESSTPLLYPGRINTLFGESGGGKTWVALAAVAETVQAGGHALVIDYEDTASGIAERLVLLALTDDEIARVHYVNPSTALGLGLPVLERIGREHDLVVLDSTGEAMAAGGTNPNADEEVARWFVLVKHLCRLPGGPAVVVLDHVPKDKEAPSAFAIGSQRKRAAVTGAAYRVDTIKEPAKGRSGVLKLTVAKDRPGNRAKGTTAAMVDIDAHDDGSLTMRFHLSDAQMAAEHGGRFRPTVLMERCSRWLEINPGAGKRALVTSVSGKREAIETALDVLVEEGWMALDDGPRGAKMYRVVRSYREADDTPAPVDNYPSDGDPRTRVHPRTDSRTARVDDPRTRVPPPTGVRGSQVHMDDESWLDPRTGARVDDDPVDNYGSTARPLTDADLFP